MASLLQLHDAIARQGDLDARQLSHQLATPLPLVEAMLQQLTSMGKIEQITSENSCLSASCKNCLEGQTCQPARYRLRAAR